MLQGVAPVILEVGGALPRAIGTENRPIRACKRELTHFCTVSDIRHLRIYKISVLRTALNGADPATTPPWPSWLSASRNVFIFAFATSLCFEHTIPNTGAAGFFQPGTGQNWRGAFFRGLAAFAIGESFAGRPGQRQRRSRQRHDRRLRSAPGARSIAAVREELRSWMGELRPSISSLASQSASAKDDSDRPRGV